MIIKKNDCLESTSQDEIVELENRIGAPLPSDYKSFLLNYNGGCPDPNEFAYIEGNMQKYAILQMFLGFSNITYRSLYYAIEVFKERDERLPSNLIPIANDVGGNLICISVEGDDVGKVYFWDMDDEANFDEGEVASYRNVYWIADNFTDFIARITKF
jgi:hypothetical protein